ncbi:hypothetical protein F511_22247 [Dorcoceras hygrometricum]|uniref:Uncharacterized protein n=1 Tax=Dorcoceras hygrometricum TaxID=472368 RepID=A0A2Z7A6K7_9LAMI|nr:hypothetical protein F511_22247 [Dorcoceras hygrometricum]
MKDKASELETSICDVKYHVSLPPSLERRPSLSHTTHRPPPLAPPRAAVVCRRLAPPLPLPHDPSTATVCRRLRGWTCSDHHDEEIPFVPNSLGLLVQADEGVVFPVVDLIKEDLPPPTVKSQNSLRIWLEPSA